MVITPKVVKDRARAAKARLKGKAKQDKEWLGPAPKEPARLGPLSDAIKAAASEKREPSSLARALDIISNLPPDPDPAPTPLPHIDDVAQAFFRFHQKATSTSLNSVRNPDRWQKDMQAARDELRTALETMGLADGIDWTPPKD